jgi:hypothetical protein
MSLITEFISIFGAQDTDNPAADAQPQAREVYSSFDVEDIYDEEYDNAIDEEWD